MNVLEQIDQANAAHTLHLKQMILNGVRDLLFGETAESLHTPLPPLAEVIAANGSLRARKKSGGKRTAQEIQVTTNKLLSAIHTAPGSRIEYLSAQLNIPTKELALSVKKLLANGQIRAKGQKRATTYAPAGKAK